jgi:hypothetical protein
VQEEERKTFFWSGLTIEDAQAVHVNVLMLDNRKA